MCPHTCKVGPQASFIMENIDADIPCIFFKTFRSPLQDILQRELHIFTRTWLIMLITIKPWLPSIHLNSPWYARWAICIVHVWSAIAYGIWVIQSYAETYLLGILYNCRRLVLYYVQFKLIAVNLKHLWKKNKRFYCYQWRCCEKFTWFCTDQ